MPNELTKFTVSPRNKFAWSWSQTSLPLSCLIAPRPVYVNGGMSDQWSDLQGELLSLVAAGPVYRLLGAEDLGTEESPELDRPIASGQLGFHLHSQGHQSVPEAWKQFLKFADRRFSEETLL